MANEPPENWLYSPSQAAQADRWYSHLPSRSLRITFLKRKYSEQLQLIYFVDFPTRFGWHEAWWNRARPSTAGKRFGPNIYKWAAITLCSWLHVDANPVRRGQIRVIAELHTLKIILRHIVNNWHRFQQSRQQVLIYFLSPWDIPCTYRVIKRLTILFNEKMEKAGGAGVRKREGVLKATCILKLLSSKQVEILLCEI